MVLRLSQIRLVTASRRVCSSCIIGLFRESTFASERCDVIMKDSYNDDDDDDDIKHDSHTSHSDDALHTVAVL